jgi:hypothetical protein
VGRLITPVIRRPSRSVEGKGDVAARHRQPLHRVEAGGIFCARAAQELAPGRNLVEQPFDPHPGAGRQRRRPLAGRLAVIDCDSPAVGAAYPAFQGQPRDAGDRRQGLPAEAEAGDAVDRIVGELGGGVPLEREAHLVRRHPAAVVGHFDQLEPARRQPHRDLRRSGVERILDDLLERAGRPLDDLAGSDAIDQFRRQPSY